MKGRWIINSKNLLTKLSVLAILLTVFIPLNGMAEEATVIDDFESGLKQQWETKEFKGRTRYSVVEIEGRHALKAESNASASALIFRYKYDLKDFPILSWKWKVENTIKKGDETKKGGDDYAARVYVIFHSRFWLLTKSINYIWANKLPKGQHISNPFASNVIMVAVESGSENVGKWLMERRNVYEDYKAIFGEEPPLADAVAIMTDTDNTGESATAYYGDIRIEKN